MLLRTSKRKVAITSHSDCGKAEMVEKPLEVTVKRCVVINGHKFARVLSRFFIEITERNLQADKRKTAKSFMA